MGKKDIFNFEWTKRWSSPFRLLGCSYWGRQYITTNKRIHGAGFHHILFTHQNGITNCYRVKSETADFGKFLSGKAINEPGILLQWTKDLKKYADDLRGIFKDSPASFFNLKRYEELELKHDLYTTMAIANNLVVEYLPEELINKYGSLLADARTYTESIYNELEQLLRNITKLVAEKEDYDTLTLTDILNDEFKLYLEDGNLPSRELLEERYSCSGLYFDGDSRIELDGREVIEIERAIFEAQGRGGQKEVVGKSASPGIARGVCRIVPHPARVNEFNDGDILITGMTRPNFVPLMKRAGAIVTDAGGLLCHAAIVSRELGKPCVIATEIATKIFRDGDMVEVDAEKGIVRKI